MRALHSQTGRVGSAAGASCSGRLQQEHCSSLWRSHHRSRHTASSGVAAAAARGQGAAGPHNSSSSSNSSRPRGPTQLQLQPQQQQQQRVVCSQAVSSSVSPAPSDQRQDQGARSELPAGPAAPPLQGKNGVLLLNLGGPESLEDVRPFLYNLFADPDIIRLPETLKFLQPLLANIIATLRSPKSSEGYAAIGGGSPLRRITDEQADALGKALRSRGLDAEVYVAMRYWHPYTEEALQHVVRDGITHLVILPLYPQFSISTSGSSLRLLEQLFKSDPVLRNLKHTVIPSWYQRPGYVGAMVDLIEQELNKFDTPEQVNVFFSAHGVPKSYVEEAGDPYKEEMEECVALIMAELRRRGRLNDHTLAYQSRVGPVEWLQPYTDDSIRSLGAAGVKSLLAVPISFVSEHIETLEEIDMEYRELALESGVEKWGRVPALNTNARFIEDLADAVVEALPYVGVIAGAPTTGNALVPMGDLDTLLDAYDRDRRTLPAPVEPWSWGWTKSAETWNGRIAMVAIIVILLLEATTGQSFLSNVMVLD